MLYADVCYGRLIGEVLLEKKTHIRMLYPDVC